MSRVLKTIGYRAAQAAICIAVILGARAGIQALTAQAALPASTSTPAPAGPTGDPVTGPLTVAPEDTGAHYNRDDWPTWDYVADGCNRREVTLKEQGHNVVTGKGCTVVAGQWTDRTPVP